MAVIDQIRSTGISIELHPEGLTVEPASLLTDEQREFLIGHKPEIRRELLAERWHWFLSLSAEHGIHPDVVAAEFQSEDDRLDVIEPPEHTDEILIKCMATLCASFTVRRRQQRHELGEWVTPQGNNHAISTVTGRTVASSTSN